MKKLPKCSIFQITLVIPDYDEAIEYYTKVLEFELLEDTDLGNDKRWVRVAPHGSNMSLLLAKAVNKEQTQAIGLQAGGRVFLFMHTEDCRETYNILKDRGVDLIDSPRVEPYGTVVVFQDKFGNKWDLIEPK